jgi:hypothetical protein
MAELRLLSLSRAEVLATHQRARAGDTAALHAFAEIWADYADGPLVCFLCDGETATPPFTMVLPERHGQSDALAAPLCPTCAALPPMQRLGRAVKVLKKMWPGWHLRARPGR